MENVEHVSTILPINSTAAAGDLLTSFESSPTHEISQVSHDSINDSSVSHYHAQSGRDDHTAVTNTYEEDVIMYTTPSPPAPRPFNTYRTHEMNQLGVPDARARPTLVDSHRITIRDDQEFLTPSPAINPIRSHNSFGSLLLHIYTVALVVMFPAITSMLQLKYQNMEQCPFETHIFFANTANVAYAIATLTSVILLRKESHMCSSLVAYKIIKSVFLFASILAPLSLELVLLVPRGFYWIGYLIIFTLFLIVLSCTFKEDIKSLCEKFISNSEVVDQRDEDHHIP